MNRAAADPRFLLLYRRACERHDSYLHTSLPSASTPRIAYFSMEYGLLDCMQIYSGGLGFLSGDHLKAASDGDFALTGVGLLYQNGYLQQYLNPGWLAAGTDSAQRFLHAAGPSLRRRTTGRNSGQRQPAHG